MRPYLLTDMWIYSEIISKQKRKDALLVRPLWSWKEQNSISFGTSVHHGRFLYHTSTSFLKHLC
uniref:Uncharacterized protein n=1 Tax=Arundo donax TaxID=35708 RepID=A0A0A8YSS4_ARUDO